MNGHAAVESANHLTEAGIKVAKAIAREEPAIHDLDACLLTITLSTTPRKVPEPNSTEVWDVKSCTDQYVRFLNPEALRRRHMTPGACFMNVALTYSLNKVCC